MGDGGLEEELEEAEKERALFLASENAGDCDSLATIADGEEEEDGGS